MSGASPEWRAQAALRLEWDRWAFTWETRFTDDVDTDPDAWTTLTQSMGFPTPVWAPPDDVLCRDYARAEDYFRHSTSLFYRADTWEFRRGYPQRLQRKAPVVDGSEVLSYSYTPIGYGYDLQGRVFFLDVSYRFRGGN